MGNILKNKTCLQCGGYRHKKHCSLKPSNQKKQDKKDTIAKYLSEKIADLFKFGEKYTCITCNKLTSNKSQSCNSCLRNS